MRENTSCSVLVGSIVYPKELSPCEYIYKNCGENYMKNNKSLWIVYRPDHLFLASSPDGTLFERGARKLTPQDVIINKNIRMS